MLDFPPCTCLKVPHNVAILLGLAEQLSCPVNRSPCTTAAATTATLAAIYERTLHARAAHSSHHQAIFGVAKSCTRARELRFREFPRHLLELAVWQRHFPVPDVTHQHDEHEAAVDHDPNGGDESRHLAVGERESDDNHRYEQRARVAHLSSHHSRTPSDERDHTRDARGDEHASPRESA